MDLCIKKMTDLISDIPCSFLVFGSDKQIFGDF